MAAIIAFDVCPAAAQDTAALSPEAVQPAPAGDDYYTQRARRTLEAEKRAVVKPHPLAANYPGMDIVVCEAGCTSGRGARWPPLKRRAGCAKEGFMMVTSATPPMSLSAGATAARNNMEGPLRRG